MCKPRYLPAGDTALVVEFGNEISPAINRQIRALDTALAAAALPGLVETVPTYRSLMLHYEPEILPAAKLTAALDSLLDGLDETALPPAEVLEIPVLYGGEAGPDLESVAAHAGLTPAQVIERHTKPEYLIYMLGFTPGFTYLGGLDETIAAPRLAQPRVKIPAGSVGIAGSQTGVYPIESPGGWQLIGRTPVKLYDPHRPMPVLPEAGQYIRFYPIDQAEYDRIAALEAGAGYCCRRHPKEEVQP